MNVSRARHVSQRRSSSPCIRGRLVRRRCLVVVMIAAWCVAWCTDWCADWCAAVRKGRAEESAGTQAADGDVEASPLEFTRVHVPAGRLSDIPLGTARYVPMSAREFEEGIARLSTGGPGRPRDAAKPAVQPLADAARYVMALVDDGSLEGTVSFDIGTFGEASGGRRLPQIGIVREMPLGNLDVRSAAMRTGAGMGEAVVFGRRDGTVAVSIAEAGTYTCDFRCSHVPGTREAPRFSFTLVPALSSTITLRLPRGMQPLVGGDLRVRQLVEPQPDQAVHANTRPTSPMVSWEIDTGPREVLDLALVVAEQALPMISLWTDVGIRGRQSSLRVLVQPTAPWLPGRIRLEKDEQLLVTHVALAPNGRADTRAEAAWTVAEDGTAILIDLPPRCVGRREPLMVKAVAPIARRAAPLPLVRAPAEAWAGGGIAIHVAPSLSLASIELEHCMVVPPEVATRWPLAVAAGTALADAMSRYDGDEHAVPQPADAAPGVWPARLFVEEQGPGTTVTLSLLPHAADLDVARVTTVDLSPGLVVGRAACDVRVHRGESFDLTARITPGWFIDSVEAIALPTPAEPSAAPRRRHADEPAAGLDWKVIRDARGDLLRIGLIVAATPARGLGLRITGHRAGIPLGEDFSTASIDMVRLDGETERSALVDVRTSPETIVEFDTAFLPSAERSATGDPAQADGEAFGPDSRLAALVEDGAARARMWAGFRASSRTARLVRRRPPLDARTEVRLTVRDDRLTESVTFECQPSASDLDSIVVQFSTPVDERLEWSLLPPAVGAVSARRLDSSDRRSGPGGTTSAGAERWLVELNPPARGPVTIRAARTIPFSRATPVLLAWVDGATSTLGHCIVRSVGRMRPHLINRRLDEVPPESAVAEPGPVTVAELSFDPTAAGDTADEAAAELVPGGDDARAWAWREIATSWCHASGATEHETRFEIDNHGRTSLTLTLPPRRRVQGILLDGLRLPLGDRAAAGGEVPIELPAGRSLVTLLVRTVTEGGRTNPQVGSGAWSAWRVDPTGVTLDIPVLQREWRLLLPPDLEIALVGGASRIAGNPADSRDWATRLFAFHGNGYPWPSSTDAARRGGVLQGFREVMLAPAGGDADVVVVHARVLSAAAMLAGVIAGCGTLLAARASVRAAVLMCLIAGVSTLWLVTPFDAIARAAWWASLAAVVFAATRGLKTRGTVRFPWSRASLAMLLVGVSLAADPALAADAGQESGGGAASAAPAASAQGRPLQVFVTPIDAGHEGDRQGEATVLVPEELFRAIIRGEEGRGAATVRVLAVRVIATAPEGDGTWSPWRLAIDIDADTGGLLVLDQAGSGARYGQGTLRIDGAVATARVTADGSLLRIMVPAAGRHTVTVDVEPASQRRGEVETATMALPFAPAASLQLLRARGGTVAADAMICEQAAVPGSFSAATRRSSDSGAVVFDVSRSAQVRLTRPLAAGGQLAVLPPAAVSRNDIFWNLDECRLTGVYEIEAGDAIVRSCVVRADPGLEWIAPPGQQDGQQPDDASAVEGVSIRPLGGRRFLVERHRPEQGRFRFEMPFRMPYADPVGVFDVPEAWLEDVLVDTRSVRFVASPSLAVRIDLPAGLTHMAVPDGEASFETRFWQGEVSRAIAVDARTDAAPASPFPAAASPPATRARLTSERRHQEIRGSQRETVAFAAEQVRIRLDARLDASSMALVSIPLDVPEGCVIDRIELVEDEVLHPETAERGAIDLRWSRPAETSVDVVVQRPRAGRFRMEVDARIPGRPAARGPMPCLRVRLADGSRTLIEWRAEDGLRATAGETGAAAEGSQFELVTGDAPPVYLLEAAAAEPVSPVAVADEPVAAPAAGGAVAEGRVELADIRVVADERGRMWGLACFELVPAEQVVRIQLPRSWRLFDAVVDGRPVDCVVPAATTAHNVWEIRLLDAGWPRTVVVLFAGELFVGELGRRLLDGEPLALSPPAIIGLPCRQVLWTVQVPAGISLRVAAPARLVAAADMQAERLAAQQRLQADFQRAIERSVDWHQERVRGFLESRRDGTMPVADEAWSRALTSLAAPIPPPPPLSIVAADESAGSEAGRLTIRAVRQRDPTTRGRALATLSLLACGGLAWMLARRR